ncbi:MAG: hypothetical protein HC883_05070 [Bdellovibrionaceae bacterium]|nr:hypothetical protein [Pseudobdellovibrionaceae bacterium]
MTQLKVFEFAKEIGVETLALMDKIREWKLPVRSHMATLDEQLQTEIKTRLAQASQAAAEEALKAKRKAVRSKKAADAAAGAIAPVEKKEKKTAVKKAGVVKKAAEPKAAAPIKRAAAAKPAPAAPSGSCP